MTVLIPYKQDVNEGEELGFALRSIDKYLTGVTNLIIIGDPPCWYKGEFIKAQDYIGRKQYTIYSKLLIGCELKNCTDDFIMFNDDHFMLNHLDVSEIKYWYDESLVNTKNKSYGARYYQAIQNTLKLVPHSLNYDIHVPIIYNKSKFRSIFGNKQDEVCIKSYYSTITGVEGEYMNDLKINQLFSEEAIKELIKNRLFFSTGGSGIREPMIKVLKQLYPTKSQWEK